MQTINKPNIKTIKIHVSYSRPLSNKDEGTNPLLKQYCNINLLS